ncbi:helix-turn-helix domain-containing protein [Kribbella sp. CA-293567]|uniref:helix-turn-helix domain-containing protein n=1 Tax=Kribbella sp. CA-293567 TaxID=3002436 RepID=UPI0022DE8661|nr:XRE family transcriptional regulator [Kribbella sp. CA-293567]WBQ04332.1 XRE family transcriptional regulator [Kribbella sp. CA-293567]
MTSASTVGKRIQRLRVANGWSQAEFALACGIATGAISMIENGRQAADSNALKAMAKRLGCTPDYLTRPQRDLVASRPWLRAYADASKRAVDRYVADTEAAVEAIEFMGLKSLPEIIPVFGEDLNDEDAIEDFAEQVREAAKLHPGDVVGNSMRAAERLGCVVLPMDDELGRHMGMSLRVNGFPVIRVSRPIAAAVDADGGQIAMPSGDRQRFTVAHELGHLSLHTACPPPATADEGTRYERQAHRFAGAFLAPAEPLLEDLKNLGDRVTLTTLQGLKERWGVAIKMLVVRLRQLDRIDDAQARSLYKQISARKWNKVEPVSVGHEEAIWFERALSRAYKRQAISTLELASAHNGLSRQYHERWIDWSVRPFERSDDPVTVVNFVPTSQRRSTGRTGRSASIHKLRRN